MGFGYLVSQVFRIKFIQRIAKLMSCHTAYWLLPGHYILEGLVASQFYQDTTPIAASQGSPYYNYLVTEGCDPNACVGTAEQWIFVSFGGKFAFDNLPWNFLYLLGLFVAARIICFVALVKFNYLTK